MRKQKRCVSVLVFNHKTSVVNQEKTARSSFLFSFYPPLVSSTIPQQTV